MGDNDDVLAQFFTELGGAESALLSSTPGEDGSSIGVESDVKVDKKEPEAEPAPKKMRLVAAKSQVVTKKKAQVVNNDVKKSSSISSPQTARPLPPAPPVPGQKRSLEALASTNGIVAGGTNDASRFTNGASNAYGTSKSAYDASNHNHSHVPTYGGVPLETNPNYTKNTAAKAASGSNLIIAAGGANGGGDKKRHIRAGAGAIWEDRTLDEWPENDFRLFVGDLGSEVNDEMLSATFRSKYPSFAMARVVRDKKTRKSRGYGFVSFLDGLDCMKALREMNGKYLGNRPMKITKSKWEQRAIGEVRKKDRKKKKLEKMLGVTL